MGELFSMLKRTGDLDWFATQYRRNSTSENYNQLFFSFNHFQDIKHVSRAERTWVINNENKKNQKRFPNNGTITVCPPSNPTHCRKICPKMWGFLIKRQKRFVHTKLAQVWKNKLSNPGNPMVPIQNKIEAEWKQNLKKWLLGLNLQVLHYCKSTGVIRLSLEKTEDIPTLQSLYLKWIVHFNPEFLPHVEFLKAFAKWFKTPNRNEIPRPEQSNQILFPKFSTFKKYFYKN